MWANKYFKQMFCLGVLKIMLKGIYADPITAFSDTKGKSNCSNHFPIHTHSPIPTHTNIIKRLQSKLKAIRILTKGPLTHSSQITFSRLRNRTTWILRDFPLLFWLIITSAKSGWARHSILRLHNTGLREAKWWFEPLHYLVPIPLCSSQERQCCFAPAAAACFGSDRINWVWTTAGRRAALRHTECQREEPAVTRFWWRTSCVT